MHRGGVGGNGGGIGGGERRESTVTEGKVGREMMEGETVGEGYASCTGTSVNFISPLNLSSTLSH